MTLCSLADVKTLLNIPQDTTEQDAKLNLLIKIFSAKIESYLGYKLAMSDYTEELHAVNNRQLLQLNALPLRSVTSVTADDGEITDYKIIPEYARWGRLYRGNGWNGMCYTRGFTYDVVSGAWDIVVTYRAGYYLPGDEGYVEGADDSLPYDIVCACMQAVQLEFLAETSGAKGLKAHTEGGISDTYADNVNDVDLSASVKKALESYVFYGLA